MLPQKEVENQSSKLKFHDFLSLVLKSVQFRLMQVYSLRANDRKLVEVAVQAPRWLPVRPVVPVGWLRSIVAGALREYFKSHPVYLECERSASSEIFN